MSWKNRLVAIYTPTGVNTGVYGTGIPIREGLILTARHVVQPDKRGKKPIKVCWWYSDTPGFEDFRDLEQDKESILWCSEEHDVALLRCDHPPDIAGWSDPHNAKPQDGVNWFSEGFPRAAKVKDVRQPSSFGGTVFSRADAENFFELKADVYPETEEEWGGASGMPVVVDDRVLGVFVQVPGCFGSKKLQAAPMWKLLKDDDFRSLVLPQHWDEFKQSYLDMLTDALENLGETARRRLERNLRRVDRAAAALVIGQKMAKLAERWFQKDFEEVMRALRDTQRQLEEQEPGAGRTVAEVAWIAAPALCDPVLAASLSQRRDQAEAALIEVPIGMLTMAELLMAAIDQRPAEHRARTHKGDDPPGTSWIPLAPEMGPDIGGRAAAQAICHHLEKTVAPEIFLDAVEDFFASPAGVYDAVPGQSREEVRRIVRQRLQDARDDREASYYLTVHLPSDPNQRTYLESAMRQVREAYPQVMVLGLELQFMESDNKRLGRFRQMLRKREDTV